VTPGFRRDEIAIIFLAPAPSPGFSRAALKIL
jgi:hypothetical protein